MPLETATYITDLVSANPPGTDGLNQADDHLRLIKAVVQASFPAINAPVTATPTELNQLHAGNRTLGLANGTSGAPSIYFDSEPGLGFYRISAGHLNLPAGKRLGGNGTVPLGSIHQFCIDPGSAVMARAATATGTEQYLECDGSVYNIATFPDLGAALGSTYGGNGTTTFGVPNCTTTQRYLRSRSLAGAVGITQANQNKSHTHGPGNLNKASYTPTGGVTVNAASTGISATVVAVASTSGQTCQSGANFGVPSTASTITVSISDPTHVHGASFAGNASLLVMDGGVTGTGSADGSEARPETLVVIMAVKT